MTLSRLAGQIGYATATSRVAGRPAGAASLNLTNPLIYKKFIFEFPPLSGSIEFCSLARMGSNLPHMKGNRRD
jgi:hypothetical protein